MTATAASWQATTPGPLRVAEAVVQAGASVHRPAAGIVFVSGALSQRLLDVADAIRDVRAGIPIVIAAGAGVLTERGEVEDQSAASGLIWSGGKAEIFPIPTSEPDEFGDALAQVLADNTGQTAPAALLLASASSFGASTLRPLKEARCTPHLFGGGTIGAPGSAVVTADGEIIAGPLVLVLRGLPPPSIRTAHSCRLLAPLHTITLARGSMVLALDGRPALDVLGEIGRSLPERPLILTVLAQPEGVGAPHGGRPDFVVRGVQGVDSARGGLLISDDVHEGMRMTFGVRDANAAREDLEAVTRELARDIAGAAPRFGLYVNCAGRGVSLYGSYDVDTRILRSRFGGTPIAGMQSAFEISPHLGKPTLQLYTGVLGLFTSPS